MSLKAFGIVVVAILIAMGGGWFWGASGKSALSAERRAAVERATIAEARAALLQARLSLIASNFGDAARDLETARRLAADLQTHLREIRQPERAGLVTIVLDHIREAERLTSALDRSAVDAAAKAAEALGAVRK
jgi:hypothetical protein